MRILVVNDDGIDSPGIAELARIASGFGDVRVVAPATQCSGMSQHVTVRGDLELRRIKDYPVAEAEAWSLTGTPADCVRAALDHLYDEAPDLVLSGINDGYNIGKEILYSGTIGAAMEALANGVPAMAFSAERYDDLRASAHFIPEILKGLLKESIEPWELWNVNLPGLSPEDIKGVRFDSRPSSRPYYKTAYELLSEDGKDEDDRVLRLRYMHCDEPEEGSDIDLILKGYITVARIRNAVIRETFSKS